jgi:hypothetical protein
MVEAGEFVGVTELELGVKVATKRKRAGTCGSNGARAWRQGSNNKAKEGFRKKNQCRVTLLM